MTAPLTQAGRILAEEIRCAGAVSFRRFMETALYHPEYGYYRRPRDPFGKCGDFYTAGQLQPVFGILMAALIRRIHAAMGAPGDFTVVELGPGRGEMAGAFSEWRYVPVRWGESMPQSFRGVVFSNEFFDALPVEAVRFEGGVFRRLLVAIEDGRFVWRNGERAAPETEDYLRRFFPPAEEGRWYEANLEALAWMERIAGALQAGAMLTIDYGYTRRESIRFPAGTLMGYHRHTASENVLEDPGERDITAHVNFSALEEWGAARGLRTRSFETLARILLDAGEADQFAAALGSEDDARRRMQLKTLLFGMGETFRVLWQEKGGKPEGKA